MTSTMTLFSNMTPFWGPRKDMDLEVGWTLSNPLYPGTSYKCKFLGLIQDLLNQKFWERVQQAILTSPPGDSMVISFENHWFWYNWGIFQNAPKWPWLQIQKFIEIAEDPQGRAKWATSFEGGSMSLFWWGNILLRIYWQGVCRPGSGDSLWLFWVVMHSGAVRERPWWEKDADLRSQFRNGPSPLLWGLIFALDGAKDPEASDLQNPNGTKAGLRARSGKARE